MIVLGKIYFKSSSIRAQLLLGFLLFFISCAGERNQYVISGNTMGTTFLVKLVSSESGIDIQPIEVGIDSILIKLNREMSTWDPKSEISKFNSHKSLEPFPISNDLIHVIDNSIDVSKKTNGLFDITVYDLMRIWGFGPNPMSAFPNNNDIAQVLNFTGYENIEIKNKNLSKSNERIKLDLNAIAKGFGVDKVFEFVRSKGFEDVFVEIGGEARCHGKNRKNKSWSIGIEDPMANGITQSDVSGIISLNKSAIATSGNYRNIVNLDGEILGHTINPKTGFPIQTDVISVTVLSQSCMIADAWATALMVMDHNTGYAKVEGESGIDAVWILQDSSEGKRFFSTSGKIKINKMKYPFK